MHAGRLATLFSARNYISSAADLPTADRNDGALLLLAPDGEGHLRVRAKRLLHAEYTHAGT